MPFLENIFCFITLISKKNLPAKFSKALSPLVSHRAYMDNQRLPYL